MGVLQYFRYFKLILIVCTVWLNWLFWFLHLLALNIHVFVLISSWGEPTNVLVWFLQRVLKMLGGIVFDLWWLLSANSEGKWVWEHFIVILIELGSVSGWELWAVHAVSHLLLVTEVFVLTLLYKFAVHVNSLWYLAFINWMVMRRLIFPDCDVFWVFSVLLCWKMEVLNLHFDLFSSVRTWGISRWL